MSRNSRNKEGGRHTGSSWSGRAGMGDKPGMAARSGRQAREVDLHLPPGHSGTEALERQLARVRGELNSAIRAGDKEIIFIHGAGSGRLRGAIHALIASEYPSCACRDAPFARYGFDGATVVIIIK